MVCIRDQRRGLCVELETRRGGADRSVGRSRDRAGMLIQVGYELSLNCSQETPMIFMLNIHSSRASDVVTPDLQQVWTDEIMESVRSV